VAGSLSDFAEAKVLDLIFKGATWTQLASGPWVALFTTAPTDSAAGTEVTGGSYARVQVATADWTRSATAPTQVTNNAVITFAAPSANWGTVTGMAIMDASTAGNILAWADLTTSRVINNGDGAPSFAASALTFTLD
jgi:hypothetical protein